MMSIIFKRARSLAFMRLTAFALSAAANGGCA
jgi:hypothetical protein